MDNQKIGNLIAKLRKEKNMTQQELGAKVGVGSRAVSKWECGVTTPDISIINELSSILGISPKELLSGTQNEQEDTPTTNHKQKLSLKLKLLIIYLIILIILSISLLTYYNNKTYVYDINASEYEKYKVEGSVTYKNGIIFMHINTFSFHNSELHKLKIQNYQYSISLGERLLFGYEQTQEDIRVANLYTIFNIEDILTQSYTISTNISQKELLNKPINIKLLLLDIDNNQISYNIEITLYEKRK